MNLDIKKRPFVEGDRPLLEQWRKDYAIADLELPHGYMGQRTETCVCEKDGKVVLALTGTQVVSLDPLLRDPNADDRVVAKALEIAEEALTYLAVRGGCVDAYVAIPESLVRYIPFLQKRGYNITAQHCVIMSKCLVEEPIEEVAEEVAIT